MRRDMDLVRRILIELSESSGPLPASAFASEEVPPALAVYHFEIMAEAGLIVARVTRAKGTAPSAVAERMTWEGEEFLANVRSDGVWSRVKLAIAKAAGDASLSVFKDVAARLVTDAVLQ